MIYNQEWEKRVIYPTMVENWDFISKKDEHQGFDQQRWTYIVDLLPGIFWFLLQW